jgi:hypothetical protein
MNIQHPPPLVRAFLEDHRQLTRLLAKLRKALGHGDWKTSQNLARQLNALGGPHIDFEENVLYPLVRKLRGPRFAGQLYQEHQVVRQALEQLLSLPAQPPGGTALADLAGKVKMGLKHAESCGTLVSHLQALPSQEQAQALAKLQQLRSEGRKWTELPRAAGEQAAAHE